MRNLISRKWIDVNDEISCGDWAKCTRNSDASLFVVNFLLGNRFTWYHWSTDIPVGCVCVCLSYACLYVFERNRNEEHICFFFIFTVWIVIIFFFVCCVSFFRFANGKCYCMSRVPNKFRTSIQPSMWIIALQLNRGCLHNVYDDTIETADSLHSQSKLTLVLSFADCSTFSYFTQRIQRFISESTDIASISFWSSVCCAPPLCVSTSSSFVVLISFCSLSCSFFSLVLWLVCRLLLLLGRPKFNWTLCAHSSRHSTRIEGSEKEKRRKEINIRRTNQLHTIFRFFALPIIIIISRHWGRARNWVLISITFLVSNGTAIDNAINTMCYQRVCAFFSSSPRYQKLRNVMAKNCVDTARLHFDRVRRTSYERARTQKSNQMRMRMKILRPYVYAWNFFYDTFRSRENPFSSVWSAFREAKVPLPHCGCSAGCMCLWVRAFDVFIWFISLVCCMRQIDSVLLDWDRNGSASRFDFRATNRKTNKNKWTNKIEIKIISFVRISTPCWR